MADVLEGKIEVIGLNQLFVTEANCDPLIATTIESKRHTLFLETYVFDRL